MEEVWEEAVCEASSSNHHSFTQFAPFNRLCACKFGSAKVAIELSIFANTNVLLSGFVTFDY